MTDSVNSRELVLAILLAVTKDGIYSHVAISDVLTKYQYLEKQERSFITESARAHWSACWSLIILSISFPV